MQQELARPGVLEPFLRAPAAAAALRASFAGLWALDGARPAIPPPRPAAAPSRRTISEGGKSFGLLGVRGASVTRKSNFDPRPAVGETSQRWVKKFCPAQTIALPHTAAAARRRAARLPRGVAHPRRPLRILCGEADLR